MSRRIKSRFYPIVCRLFGVNTDESIFVRRTTDPDDFVEKKRLFHHGILSMDVVDPFVRNAEQSNVAFVMMTTDFDHFRCVLSRRDYVNVTKLRRKINLRSVLPRSGKISSWLCRNSSGSFSLKKSKENDAIVVFNGSTNSIESVALNIDPIRMPFSSRRIIVQSMVL